MLVSVPTRLKELKDYFRWNNIELGNACGVSKQAVNGWINYGNNPSHKALAKLSKDHGVNSEWIVGEDTNMFHADRPVITATVSKTVNEGAMRDELRDILLEISLGDPAEADRVIKILRAYLNK